MPRTESSAHDRAVYWFTREQLGTLDEAARQERDAWLAQDPEHQRQYQALARTWQVADTIPQDDLRGMLHALERPAAPRRRLAIGLSAACALAVTASALGPRFWAADPQFSQELMTERGQRSRHTLPDGSVLELNTASRVRVALYADRRVVELLGGEALFTVSPDAARPFLVQAGNAEVRVTGTRFNVRRELEVVSLAVEEGSVAFSAGPWWNRNTRHLSAGFVLSAREGEALAQPRQDNVAAITAWQRGRLVFRDTPLAVVVAELNRYLSRPLLIGDSRLADLRVAGTLPIDEPQALLAVLPRIAPVEVRTAPDGSPRLMPRS